MSDIVIDARGLSCPEPVLMAKRALKEQPKGGFTVAVSSPTARDNVMVLLDGKGFTPVVEETQCEWFVRVPAK